MVISKKKKRKEKKRFFPLILIFNFLIFVFLLVSYCFNPYHHVIDCLEMRQFSNYHYEHMNIPFSRPGNNFYSDSYNPA
jgi:hypothetical protein